MPGTRLPRMGGLPAHPSHRADFAGPVRGGVRLHRATGPVGRDPGGRGYGRPPSGVTAVQRNPGGFAGLVIADMFVFPVSDCATSGRMLLSDDGGPSIARSIASDPSRIVASTIPC